MRRCSGIILLFLTLLAISRGVPLSGPGNDTSPVTAVTGTQTHPEVTAEPKATNDSQQVAVTDTKEPGGSSTQTEGKKVPLTKAPLSVSKLMQQIKPVFDSMPLDMLKLLGDSSSSGKVEEFEGILMELYEGQNAEYVLTLIDSLKNHFEIVPGMVRGAILKKQNDIRKAQTQLVPTKDKEQQATNKGNQQTAGPWVDGNALSEKIVLEDLLKALKAIPSDDLKHVEYGMNESIDSDNIKRILTKIQSGAAPDLSDELIAYATSHLENLKDTIEVILDGREKLDSVIVTSSFAGRTKTNSPTTVAKETEAPAVTDEQDKTYETEPDAPFNGDNYDDNLTNLLYGEGGFAAGADPNADANADNKAGDTFENTKKPEKSETNLVGKDPPNEETRTVSGGGWFGMWHFLIIFLVIAGIVGTVYVCSHNRKKIREGVGAYIADAASRGRRNRNYRYKPVSST